MRYQCLIHWFRNHLPTIERLSTLGINNLVISSVTKMELLLGADNKNELQIMNKRIAKYPVLHINEAVSQLSIELINKFHLSHNLQIPDAIIRVSAIVYRIPLYTYNIKDFKFIPGIELI